MDQRFFVPLFPRIGFGAPSSKILIQIGKIIFQEVIELRTAS